jgi:hypothetical protein
MQQLNKTSENKFWVTLMVTDDHIEKKKVVSWSKILHFTNFHQLFELPATWPRFTFYLLNNDLNQLLLSQ